LNRLKDDILKNFSQESLSTEEFSKDYNLRVCKFFVNIYFLKQSILERIDGEDSRCVLFSLLCKFLGLLFKATAYKIYINNLEVFEYQKPFEETDLLDIKGRIKYMNISKIFFLLNIKVNHSEGNVLKMRASHKTKEEAKRIYLLAINRFKESLESDPNKKNSLRNIGDCYMQIGSKLFYCLILQIDNNEDAKFY